MKAPGRKEQQGPDGLGGGARCGPGPGPAAAAPGGRGGGLRDTSRANRHRGHTCGRPAERRDAPTTSQEEGAAGGARAGSRAQPLPTRPVPRAAGTDFAPSGCVVCGRKRVPFLLSRVSCLCDLNHLLSLKIEAGRLAWEEDFKAHLRLSGDGEAIGLPMQHPSLPHPRAAVPSPQVQWPGAGGAACMGSFF